MHLNRITIDSLNYLFGRIAIWAVYKFPTHLSLGETKKSLCFNCQWCVWAFLLKNPLKPLVEVLNFFGSYQKGRKVKVVSSWQATGTVLSTTLELSTPAIQKGSRVNLNPFGMHARVIINCSWSIIITPII